MIRIALLIPTLDRSGAEKQLTLLAQGLPRDQFDVHVIALTRGGPYEATLRSSGIPVTVLGKRAKLDPRTLWRLHRHLANLRPDVVHTWLFAANAYGRLVAGTRSPYAIVVSERCVDSWKSGWQHWLDQRLMSRTTRWIGNSNSVAAFYEARGVSSDRFVVIPNGIEPYAAPTDSRDHILRELGLPSDALVVGFIGRLAAQKRLSDLVWASEMLKHLNDRMYCVFVGDGPEQDHLQRMACGLRCAEWTSFTGHRRDTTRLLSVFDVFWLASDFEGQSNSIMEAMAAGIPVVASDIAPNAELVVDGQTGFLVPVGDRPGFARKAARLLDDPLLRRQMGDAGRCRMLDQFSVQAMIDAHANLYREIVTVHGMRQTTAR